MKSLDGEEVMGKAVKETEMVEAGPGVVVRRREEYCGEYT